MLVVTWNVNSVRARQGRLLAWLEKHRPDVVCLQELKLPEADFPALDLHALGYYAAVHGQKSYNGVAILSRTPPEDVTRGFDDGGDDSHARLVHVRLGDVHFLSAYFPNGGDLGSDKWAYKLAWMERLRKYLEKRFTKDDRVVLAGDFNVAPYVDDVARPKEWEGGVLTHPDARAALERIAALGYEDCFRPFHPTGGVYTWWDYRGLGFERGNGLRIDHVYATPAIARCAIGAAVDRDERKGEAPSDHAPVMIELDWD